MSSSTIMNSEAGQIIWRRRRALFFGFLLLSIRSAAGVYLPASSKYFIDEVIGRKQLGLLVILAVGAGVATLIQALASFGIGRLLGVTAQHSITEIKEKVQQHVLRLPVSFFDGTQSGTVVSRIMNDAEGIRNLVGTGMVQLIGNVFSAVLGFGVLLYLNWRLTLITLGTLLVFEVVTTRYFVRVRPLFRRRSELMAQVTARVTEEVVGIRTVKAYNGERVEERAFIRGLHALLRNAIETIHALAAVEAVTTTLFGIVGVLLMIIGGRAIVDGTMTVGAFVTYILFTGLVAAPIVQISSMATQLGEAFAGLDRIQETLRISREREGGEKSFMPQDVSGRIDLVDVGFEYEAGQPVLKNISFTAPSGSTTAVIGPSGAGKSTLASLLLSFNEATSGAVLIDGRDLRSLERAAYRRCTGVVFQDNFLFDGTITDNIRYGKRDATMDEVLRVSRIAHVDEFVRAMPQQYDTIVGERGMKLSGGQRQRIAIARALLANPPILILDEATSSLDSEAEALIQDGLKALRAGRTTFVIAHRLSTIRSADQILVMDGGEIVERGTHEQLYAHEGVYRRLYDKQYSLVTERFVNPGEEPQVSGIEVPPVLPAVAAKV
jgi:ABC-type multidrug transport system fused ATPase/permease subunit